MRSMVSGERKEAAMRTLIRGLATTPGIGLPQPRDGRSYRRKR